MIGAKTPAAKKALPPNRRETYIMLNLASVLFLNQEIEKINSFGSTFPTNSSPFSRRT
jgi:hypothetical protein